MAPADEVPPRAKRSGIARIAAFAVGLALLIAAVVAVTRNTDALHQALESARSASPWLVLAIIVLPLANIAVISASFWVLSSRFGRVSLLEMIALIVSSWLLNHLPMRPGLLGRVGYHRVVNDIPIRASIRVIIEQLLCGVAALAIIVPVAALCAPLGTPRVVGLFLLGAAAVVGVSMAMRARAIRLSQNPVASCLAAAVGFRLLDMTIWLVRYSCLFALVGHPVGIRDAAAITAASQAAMLSPIPLGLREWTVGAVHGLLDIPAGSEGGVSLSAIAPGVAADLANRGAELLVAVPLGIIATVWLMRRARTHSRRAGEQPHPTSTPSV